MRVKVDLKKLFSAEAQFVSLVRRGANQMPFRIQKEAGDTMPLDLSAPTRIFKGERKAKTAAVAAICVKKSADMEPMKALIKKAGFSTDNMVEKEDGTVLFAQVENAEANSTPVRISEDLVMVMKDFTPW